MVNLYETETAPGGPVELYEHHWYSGLVTDEWWSVLVWYAFGFGSVLFIYLSTIFPFFFIKNLREEVFTPLKGVLRWGFSTGAIFAVIRAGSILLK